VEESIGGWKSCVSDADGKPVASCWGGGPTDQQEKAEANARLIVDAVNTLAEFEAAHMEFPDFRPVIIAAGQRDAAIAERDRLRDIVKRMANKLGVHRGIFIGAGVYSRTAQEETSQLLREARAAIKENEK
jgi:hypothetical protein